MRSLERRGGFTLIELLVVIGIIGILASLTLPIAAAVKRKARIANTRSEIARLELALAGYEHETGRYPRRPGPLPSGNDLFRNDAPWMYAALRNAPTAALGGGPTTLMSDWDRSRVAAVKDDVLAWDFASVNPADSEPAAPWVEPIADQERALLDTSGYQAAHLPGSGRALVFLDIWGNPYVYVEWATLPRSVRENAVLKASSLVRSGGTPEPHELRSQGPFVIISFGPNGVYEFGGGDDVCSFK